MIGSRSLGVTVHSPVVVLGRVFSVASLAVVSASVIGLALAAPSIWWSSARLVISDPQRGSVISDQSSWSWGQLVARSGDSFERVFPNTPGLVLFVACLVVGLLAVLWWAWRPGPVGALVGVLGLTVAAIRVLTAVTERLGSAPLDAYANTGLDVRSYLQPAAVAETVAAVVLVLALAAMVALAVASPPSGPEPSGIPTDRDGTTPGGGRTRLTGLVSGFRDDASRPEERPDGRPDHRFEPPS